LNHFHWPKPLNYVLTDKIYASIRIRIRRILKVKICVRRMRILTSFVTLLTHTHTHRQTLSIHFMMKITNLDKMAHSDHTLHKLHNIKAHLTMSNLWDWPLSFSYPDRFFRPYLHCSSRGFKYLWTDSSVPDGFTDKSVMTSCMNMPRTYWNWNRTEFVKIASFWHNQMMVWP